MFVWCRHKQALFRIVIAGKQRNIHFTAGFAQLIRDDVLEWNVLRNRHKIYIGINDVKGNYFNTTLPLLVWFIWSKGWVECDVTERSSMYVEPAPLWRSAGATVTASCAPCAEPEATLDADCVVGRFRLHLNNADNVQLSYFDIAGDFLLNFKF